MWRKLRDRRIELSVSQELLSELSGVNVRTIKQLENNQGNPTIATLQKLAEVLGLEIRLEVKGIHG